MSYNPQIPPQSVDDLVMFISEELVRIAQAYNNKIDGQHDILYKSPIRVKPGMVVYADGTSWNPGGGEGLYRYSLSGSWIKIG